MAGEDLAPRASDAERDDVAGALARACAEGRLSPEELEGRVQRVYAATRRPELDALLADIPKAARATAAARPARKRHFAPGIVTFSERADVSTGRTAAFDAALSTFVPALARAGYHVVATERPTLIRLERRRRIAAPYPLTIVFTDAPERGTRIASFGEAPRSIRKAFAEL
jgi:DUF1707 SHOCT-like domain